MGLKPVPSLPRAIYARQTINAVEGIENLPDKFQPAVNFYTQFESLIDPLHLQWKLWYALSVREMALAAVLLDAFSLSFYSIHKLFH